MKTALFILLFVSAGMQPLLAQTTTLTFPNLGAGPARQQNISVLAGEVFELLTWAPDSPTSTMLKVDGTRVPVLIYNGGTWSLPSAQQAFVFAGPRTISIEVPSAQTLVCTFRLTAVSSVAMQNVASQAVVIPENGNANADVIFESSTDLTNWTAALPGSYSPSTSKRFFRVRVVAN